MNILKLNRLRLTIFVGCAMAIFFSQAHAQENSSYQLELVHTHNFNSSNPDINGDAKLLANGYLAYITPSETNELHVHNIFNEDEKTILAASQDAELATYGWNAFWLVTDHFDYNLFYGEDASSPADSFSLADSEGLNYPVTTVATMEGFVASSYDFLQGVITIYNLHDKQEHTRLTAHEALVHNIAFSHEGSNLLASADDDGRLILWDFVDETILADFDFSANYIQDIAFSPSGASLFVLQYGEVHGNTEIAIIDTNSYKITKRINSVRGDKLLAVASPEKPEGYVLSVSDELVAWIDETNNEVVGVFDNGGQALHNHNILDVVVNWQDESQLITVSADDTVKVWARADGLPIYR